MVLLDLSPVWIPGPSPSLSALFDRPTQPPVPRKETGVEGAAPHPQLPVSCPWSGACHVPCVVEDGNRVAPLEAVAPVVERRRAGRVAKGLLRAYKAVKAQALTDEPGPNPPWVPSYEVPERRGGGRTDEENIK